MKLLTRIFPYPVLALSLSALWLVFNQSLAPFDIVIGLILGAALSRIMLRLDPNPPRVRRPDVVVALAFIVARDIFVSNLRVLGMILRPRPRPHSSFVNIPLQLRDRYGLAVLATIITSTPGTFWAAYDRRSGVLTVRVLDEEDPVEFSRMVKHRYERRLLEIFG
ncbi:MAG TPA: Na+/H+ antiporter subunit E [Trueperaceae bacterium]